MSSHHTDDEWVLGGHTTMMYGFFFGFYFSSFLGNDVWCECVVCDDNRAFSNVHLCERAEVFDKSNTRWMLMMVMRTLRFFQVLFISGFYGFLGKS